MRSVGSVRLTPALAALGAIALLGWSSVGGALAQQGAANQPCVQVKKNKVCTVRMIAGDKFEPETITIKKGDSIKWVNADRTDHTATEDAPGQRTKETGKVKRQKGKSTAFHEEVAPGASSKTIRFDRAPGTITYYCIYHGTATSGMKGTIIIEP